MIIIVWNKSFVAVEVKLAVWIDHLIVEESSYRLLNSFNAVFLHDHLDVLNVFFLPVPTCTSVGTVPLKLEERIKSLSNIIKK